MTIKIANNILEELASLAKEGKPAFSTDRGDLFISSALPMAAIRLKLSVDDYVDYLASLPVDEQPNIAKLAIGVENPEIQVVVNGKIAIHDNQITLNGEPVTIL